ncbi:CsbD family protein [Bacillus xiapuensis]|uniref:CsbD family protein n=1 Tax=Bacillus xiapuensis TaxID=2014075 RepID=UPI000C234D9B|nr:CsbD family protein [Bacillus xiapuensis]
MSINDKADKWKGKSEQLKGLANEAIGKLTNDSSAKAEGKSDQMKGKLQESIGKALDKLKR